MSQRPLRIAALAMAGNGLLHLLAPAFAGLSGAGLTLMAAGVIYILLGFCLAQGWRWLAYIAFLWMLLAAVATYFSSYDPDPVPGWLYVAALVLQLVCLAGLFAALWRPKPARRGF